MKTGVQSSMVLTGLTRDLHNLDSIHSTSSVELSSMPPDVQPRASASEPPSPIGERRGAITSDPRIVRASSGETEEWTLLNYVKPEKLKCVLVGDGAIGKTSLVVSYTTNGYPKQYVPTAFDNYAVNVKVDGNPVCLQICDTAGQDDFDKLRPLCYPLTDVFLLCFSVVSPTSYHNLVEKWLPEIRSYNPKTPIILVGTQSDLRTDVNVLIELSDNRESPITEIEAKERAEKINAVTYVECSALTQHNLKEVFDTAIMTGLKLTVPPKSSRSLIRRLSKKENYLVNVPAKNKTKPRKPNIWRKLCCIPVPYDAD